MIDMIAIALQTHEQRCHVHVRNVGTLAGAKDEDRWFAPAFDA